MIDDNSSNTGNHIITHDCKKMSIGVQSSTTELSIDHASVTVYDWNKLSDSMKSVLPPKYSYIIEKYSDNANSQDTYIGAPNNNFYTQFRVNVSNALEGRKWIYQIYLSIPKRHTESVVEDK